MNTVQIHKHKVDSILRRHPWVFSGAIITETEDLTDGEVVTVADHKGRFLARGHYQHATIAVRILSFEDRPLDEDFFIERIGNAVELRKKLNLATETSLFDYLIQLNDKNQQQ